MKILVSGAFGKMGKIVCEEGRKMGHTVIEADKDFWLLNGGMCELVDGIIDFSVPSAIDSILDFAVKNNIPTLIATTGHTKAQMAKIKQASKVIPICLAANTSKGVELVNKVCSQIYSEYDDCQVEIVEYHHKDKMDSPSGTAKAIAENLSRVKKGRVVCGRRGRKKREKNEIGISSVRGGNEIGTHEIIFYSGYEIITVKHQALDRRLFAVGAIEKLIWLVGKKKGFYKVV